MYSPFASSAVQSGFDLTPTNPNPNIWKHKKHVEFMLYKLPTMLESHSSSPASIYSILSKASSQSNKHRRQRSFHTDTVGIIANINVKTVSFGVPCTLVYKRDSL
jgi:hypothetical protein